MNDTNPADVPPLRYPTTGIERCVLASSGHAARVPDRILMKSRRRMIPSSTDEAYHTNAKCRPWVKRVAWTVPRLFPIYPNQRTSRDRPGSCVSGHTHHPARLELPVDRVVRASVRGSHTCITEPIGVCHGKSAALHDCRGDYRLRGLYPNRWPGLPHIHLMGIRSPDPNRGRAPKRLERLLNDLGADAPCFAAPQPSSQEQDHAGCLTLLTHHPVRILRAKNMVMEICYPLTPETVRFRSLIPSPICIEMQFQKNAGYLSVRSAGNEYPS